MAQICKIFLDMNCVVTDDSGDKIKGLEVSTRQKHAMVKRIYSSRDIPMEIKLQSMTKLEDCDKSDLLGRTKKFCEAALPTAENKRAQWTRLFDGKEEMPMKEVWELCAGFK